MERPVSDNSRACSSGIHTVPRGTGIMRECGLPRWGQRGAESVLRPFIVSHHHLVAKRLRLDSSTRLRVSCKAVFCLKLQLSKRVLICWSYPGPTPAFLTIQGFLPCRESLLPTANWHQSWLICHLLDTSSVYTVKMEVVYLCFAQEVNWPLASPRVTYSHSQHQCWNPRRWASVV